MIITALVLQFAFVHVYSSEQFHNTLTNKEQVLKEEFIEEFSTIKKELLKLDEEELSSIILQTKAYNFSEEQVRALVNTALSDFENPAGYKGTLSDNGEYYVYENGVTLPVRINRIAEQNNDATRSGSKERTVVNSYNPATGYYDIEKTNDKTGVYWAVESNEGYTEATAFVDLPTLYNVAIKDRPYMFLAANSFEQGNSLTFIGDYGIVYNPEGGSGAGWYVFVNAHQWDDNLGGYKVINNTIYNKLPLNVTKVYLHIKIVNGESTDTVYFTCKNGNNFNQVWLDGLPISFQGNPVQPNATNLNIYHETTLAQHVDGYVNGNVNVNSGTRMVDATFSQAYLYKWEKGEYYLWNESVTKKAYRQAPVMNWNGKIHPTIISKWYHDSIDILFTP